MVLFQMTMTLIGDSLEELLLYTGQHGWRVVSSSVCYLPVPPEKEEEEKKKKEEDTHMMMIFEKDV